MRCPFCKKEISDNAVKCKYCRNYLSPPASIQGNNESCPWNFSDVFFIYMATFVLSTIFFIFLIPLLGLLSIDLDDKITLSLITVGEVYVTSITALGLIYFYFKRSYAMPVLEALKFVALKKRVLFTLIGLGALLATLGHLAHRILDLSIKDHSMFKILFSTKLSASLSIFDIVVLGPFYEEALYRGLLYPAINKKWGMEMAIVLTTGLFSFMHVVVRNSPTDTFMFFVVLSVFLTLIRAKTQSTTASLVLHVSYNLATLLFVLV